MSWEHNATASWWSRYILFIPAEEERFYLKQLTLGRFCKTRVAPVVKRFASQYETLHSGLGQESKQVYTASLQVGQD